jgi:outer membrane lipoprotein SlyB
MGQGYTHPPDAETRLRLARFPPGQKFPEELAMPDVIATYRDLDHAREAMTALERGGVGSDAVSLEGRQVARAAAELDTSRRDRHVAAQVGSRVLLGGILGSAVGAVIGGLVGWLAFGSFGPILASLLAGAIAGGAVGGAVGGYGAPAENEEWELTHEAEPPGSVRVRVSSDDLEELDRAAKVLAAKRPLDLRRAG